jgi:hypothetical protein
MPQHILCFLTVAPSALFYDFVKRLKRGTNDVYICMDKNDHTIPGYKIEDGIKIIQLDNTLCEEAGFKSCTMDNKAYSRDKALYYFCKNHNHIDYSYLWLIEEDVFIPTVDTIDNIDKKYPKGDLLVKSHFIAEKRQTDWLWPNVNKQIKIEPPYAASMICAIRVSKQLMTCIDAYASTYCNLFLDEALFNTIALQSNLDVVMADELETIHWKKQWKREDIDSENLYHPVKNISQQYAFRGENG